jgi:hypothetical protein
MLETYWILKAQEERLGGLTTCFRTEVQSRFFIDLLLRKLSE